MSGSAGLLAAEHPERGRLFAAFDPAAHHVAAEVRPSRFGARMAPFHDAPSAKAALIAVGAKVEGSMS
jgi:hypothetical protein